MSARILIVEDEVDLASTVAYNLRKEGHEVEMVHEGGVGLARVTTGPAVDLVVLDLMLPDMSGIEVCRRVRALPGKSSNVPVLMLTARGEEIDRVIGFESGADDYVVKPFSPRELVLRVAALLRRSTQATVGDDAGVLQLPRMRLEPEGRQAWLDGEELDLTPLEFGVLALLVARRGRYQPRDVLLREVWGIEADVTTRTVDTTIKRLRAKLGDIGVAIETRRGVGYRFNMDRCQ